MIFFLLFAIIVAAAIFIYLRNRAPSATDHLASEPTKEPIIFHPLPITRYKVIGVNPKTGRKNKKDICAGSKESAIYIAKYKGLSDPFEVLEESKEIVQQMNMPTEKQVAYARDLGIVIPLHATRSNISAMISRVTDDDMEQPSVGIMQFLQCLSKDPVEPYTGKNAAISQILYYANDLQTCIFYVYAVTCATKNRSLQNPLLDQQFSTYEKIGERLSKDEKLLQSVRRRPAADYIKPSKNTAAYKAVSFEISRLK